MRTDRDLQADILEALAWEPGLDVTKIDVNVKSGIATLQGTVRSFFEKSTAELVTRHIYGIRGIANDLKVSLDGFGVRSDADIAKAVADAIASDSAVPLNAITVTVADGWVTLHGQVDWQYQKSAAQIDAERRTGVKGVVNHINLKPLPIVNTSEVKARIEQAFRRSAAVDSASVKVDAQGSRVVLTGTVKSLYERDQAELAAWAAPGVTKVDDRIVVSPY